jgi:signal peptidase I
MALFTPSHLKEGRSLLEGASRLLHQKRDLLSPRQISEAELALGGLRDAIASRDRTSVQRASERVEHCFVLHLPPHRHAAWAENIEAVAVAVILAVGFQAYFLKPFKIPTGSMQPTLYGMTGHPTSDPLPNPAARAIAFIRLGRSYIDVKASAREEVLGLNERTKLNFFTFTEVITSEGRYTIFAPKDVLMRDFGVTPPNWRNHPGPGRIYENGESIVHGYVQAGDQVFVDRMTYQFRNPVRSDVFVFKTTGIRRIEMRIDPALGSQFYIKRLAGMPGDTLRIDPPRLLIDGTVAQAPPFLRVMSCKDGYRGYSNRTDEGDPFPYLGSPTETFTVPPHGYFALGDNSYNSSDSRYWGIVPERNVIGRGFFVYWPFSSRWGFIR